MKSVRVVRYQQVPSTPWKNGRGLTRQLAIHPHHATADDFEWRVSVAQLEQSAEFSAYPGIDRCLAVLEGELLLQRDSCAPLALTRDSRPVQFSGDTLSSGQVLRGPVLDLNLMYRATRWHASLSRLTGGTDATLTLEFMAQGTLVCSLAAELHVQLAGSCLVLGQYDLVLASGEWQDQLITANGYDLYCIQLHRL
jgi:uncharacterized protein